MLHQGRNVTVKRKLEEIPESVEDKSKVRCERSSTVIINDDESGTLRINLLRNGKKKRSKANEGITATNAKIDLKEYIEDHELDGVGMKLYDIDHGRHNTNHITDQSGAVVINDDNTFKINLLPGRNTKVYKNKPAKTHHYLYKNRMNNQLLYNLNEGSLSATCDKNHGNMVKAYQPRVTLISNIQLKEPVNKMIGDLSEASSKIDLINIATNEKQNIIIESRKHNCLKSKTLHNDFLDNLDEYIETKATKMNENNSLDNTDKEPSNSGSSEKAINNSKSDSLATARAKLQKAIGNSSDLGNEGKLTTMLQNILRQEQKPPKITDNSNNLLMARSKLCSLLSKQKPGILRDDKLEILEVLDMIEDISKKQQGEVEKDNEVDQLNMIRLRLHQASEKEIDKVKMSVLDFIEIALKNKNPTECPYHYQENNEMEVTNIIDKDEQCTCYWVQTFPSKHHDGINMHQQYLDYDIDNPSTVNTKQCSDYDIDDILPKNSHYRESGGIETTVPFLFDTTRLSQVISYENKFTNIEDDASTVDMHQQCLDYDISNASAISTQQHSSDYNIDHKIVKNSRYSEELGLGGSDGGHMQIKECPDQLGGIETSAPFLSDTIYDNSIEDNESTGQTHVLCLDYDIVHKPPKNSSIRKKLKDHGSSGSHIHTKEYSDQVVSTRLSPEVAFYEKRITSIEDNVTTTDTHQLCSDYDIDHNHPKDSQRLGDDGSHGSCSEQVRRVDKSMPLFSENIHLSKHADNTATIDMDQQCSDYDIQNEPDLVKCPDCETIDINDFSYIPHEDNEVKFGPTTQEVEPIEIDSDTSTLPECSTNTRLDLNSSLKETLLKVGKGMTELDVIDTMIEHIESATKNQHKGKNACRKETGNIFSKHENSKKSHLHPDNPFERTLIRLAKGKTIEDQLEIIDLMLDQFDVKEEKKICLTNCKEQNKDMVKKQNRGEEKTCMMKDKEPCNKYHKVKKEICKESDEEKHREENKPCRAIGGQERCKVLQFKGYNKTYRMGDKRQDKEQSKQEMKTCGSVSKVEKHMSTEYKLMNRLLNRLRSKVIGKRRGEEKS